MKVTISIQGANEVLKELNNITEKNIQKLNNDIKNAAIYCMGEAKRNVSRPYPQGAVDTGQLMNSITIEERIGENQINYLIGTNVNYAPYVEYGTRPHFPPVQALMEWVKRHARGSKSLFGKDDTRKVAYAIAFTISKRGTTPRPFLRPAFILAKNKLLLDLEKI